MPEDAESDSVGCARWRDADMPDSVEADADNTVAEVEVVSMLARPVDGRLEWLAVVRVGRGEMGRPTGVGPAEREVT
jgi:hypothetical protein